MLLYTNSRAHISKAVEVAVNSLITDRQNQPHQYLLMCPDFLEILNFFLFSFENF